MANGLLVYGSKPNTTCLKAGGLLPYEWLLIHLGRYMSYAWKHKPIHRKVLPISGSAFLISGGGPYICGECAYMSGYSYTREIVFKPVFFNITRDYKGKRVLLS